MPYISKGWKMKEVEWLTIPCEYFLDGSMSEIALQITEFALQIASCDITFYKVIVLINVACIWVELERIIAALYH